MEFKRRTKDSEDFELPAKLRISVADGSQRKSSKRGRKMAVGDLQ